MWGYPYLTVLAIVGMLAIVAAMGFIPDQRTPLLFGVISTLVMLVGYLVRRRIGRRVGPETAPDPA
jgi:GABA permease